MVDPIRIHRPTLEELATRSDVFGETHRDTNPCRVRPPLL
jgi:hypothetical protein